MINIYLLIDYKNKFGSKYDAKPYESGMNKDLLKKYFAISNIEIAFVPFIDVINYEPSFWKGKTVLYTSSEDTGYFYKSYIEDIIYYLELNGANTVPPYKYLRSNNNKVFMELLRKKLGKRLENDNQTALYGSIEELVSSASRLRFPIVHKKAAGAGSSGVGMAVDYKELIKNIKKISRTRNLLKELWEFGRTFKYRGYIPQSKYRNKFVIQKFIEGLKGDYKVLIFGDKYYVLKRDAKKGDFRASGSGIRKYVRELPDGLLHYASKCFLLLNVPNASLDIGFDGQKYFLLEYQCLYFGSFTITYSKYYWEKVNNSDFLFKEGSSVLEEEYAKSIYKYCENR